MRGAASVLSFRVPYWLRMFMPFVCQTPGLGHRWVDLMLPAAERPNRPSM
jgi:hypothetical protein